MKNLLFILSFSFLMLFSCSLNNEEIASELSPLEPTNSLREIVPTTQINFN